MKITIRPDTIEKIKKAKSGNAVVEMLETLCERDNTEYNRGVLHGYLLTLTTIGVISGGEAIDILDQI